MYTFTHFLESGIGKSTVDLRYLPATDFKFDVCKRRILSTNIARIPTYISDADKEIFISSIISWENIQMVKKNSVRMEVKWYFIFFKKN